HAPGVVLAQLDRLGDLRLREARPARAGVELHARVEELVAAAGAAVHAVVVLVPVLTGEGALGAALAEHLVLLGSELLAPLLVGLSNVCRHLDPFLSPLEGYDGCAANHAAGHEQGTDADPRVRSARARARAVADRRRPLGPVRPGARPLPGPRRLVLARGLSGRLRRAR